jgi:hypothetical protein
MRSRALMRAAEPSGSNIEAGRGETVLTSGLSEGGSDFCPPFDAGMSGGLSEASSDSAGRRAIVRRVILWRSSLYSLTDYLEVERTRVASSLGYCSVADRTTAAAPT